MDKRIRMRRARRSEPLRRLGCETTISCDDLILPLFVVPGHKRLEEVPALPGVRRMSVDALSGAVLDLLAPAVLLFGVPDARDKDETGSSALREDGLIPAAVREIKRCRSDLAIITDVCLCGYTNSGHCGVLTKSDEPDNDRTVELLGLMAVAHAAAGADLVAPSAMMDFQVAGIRSALDESHLTDTGIMSYAAKFASSFYGPFREAVHSAPSFGDRRSYQLPPANRRQAVRDALLDESEGADWVMVKPALPYLDVLQELRGATRLPIAAYQVSGEYAMLKLAAHAGALDEQSAVVESLLCIKRAGADAIITYYAQEVCQWISR